MKTMINIKVDKTVKKNAQKTAKALGLTLSAIINSFLKQLIRNKELHISLRPKATPEIKRLINRDRKRK